MYSDKEIIALVEFAQKHVQNRLDGSYCRPKPCGHTREDGYEQCEAIRKGTLAKKAKMTYRPKLLRKILMTHYQGLQLTPVKISGKKDYLKLTGRTLQFHMKIDGVGGTVWRGDSADSLDPICEGEYEPNSFITHQVMFCRSAEDFYGSLAQFINKWDN